MLIIFRVVPKHVAEVRFILDRILKVCYVCSLWVVRLITNGYCLQKLATQFHARVGPEQVLYYCKIWRLKFVINMARSRQAC